MDLGSTFSNLLSQTAFSNLTVGNFIMIMVAFIFLYLAIKKGFEPLLLIPIAFGMLLVNIYPDIMYSPEETPNGVGGMLWYFFQLDEWTILPSLIFMGVGAQTDFAPLIANPKTFLMGAAAQFGIYAAYFVAILLGFNGKAAAAISIIGGADGPTSIFLANKLGETGLLGPIAVAAYSYMALVPIIQPPIMRALTTEKERKIRMDNLRPVSKLEKILFPIVVTVVVCLILPSTAPLVGMLMLGNLFKESGVVKQLQETAANAMMFIVVIHHLCRGLPERRYLKDRGPGPDRLRLRYCRRRGAGQDHVQAFRRQDQSAYRLCRRIRSAHGSPGIPEGGSGDRSHELPADARHGPQCGRRHRNGSGSRYLYGGIRRQVRRPGSDLVYGNGG